LSRKKFDALAKNQTAYRTDLPAMGMGMGTEDVLASLKHLPFVA
jgi:hypothetical protein